MSTHLSTDQLLHAYTVMRTIRDFEERLHVEFATGEIPGFVHLYAGQEASAAGVMPTSTMKIASPPTTVATAIASLRAWMCSA